MRKIIIFLILKDRIMLKNSWAFMRKMVEFFLDSIVFIIAKEIVMILALG
jgi:hypothetical protein